MARNVSGTLPVNANVARVRSFDIEASQSGYGSVPSSLGATCVATEAGIGVVHQTTLTLAGLAQAVVNGTEYQGTKVYDFPAGRILVLGVTASLAPTTTSAIAGTLNSGVTGSLGIGTVTASATTLASTMVDLLPATAFATSTVINVPAAAVGAALAASAQFDGTTTAVDVYLNSAFATTGDVDADATMTWAGNVTISWLNLGDI